MICAGDLGNKLMQVKDGRHAVVGVCGVGSTGIGRVTVGS